MTPPACTHCGRTNCRKYGDDDCQKAREKSFDEMQKALEYRAERDKRAAAEHDSPKEKP